MAHILKTGSKDEKIVELLREIGVARKALRAICDLAFIREDELAGAPYPEPNGKIMIQARGALNEMEDDD